MGISQHSRVYQFVLDFTNAELVASSDEFRQFAPHSEAEKVGISGPNNIISKTQSFFTNRIVDVMKIAPI